MSECQCGCGCPEKISRLIKGKCINCHFSRHYNQKTKRRTGISFGYCVRSNLK